MNAVTKPRRAAKPISIHLSRTYPHPRAKVWRAVTEPALIARWLMRPEGFQAVVGTKFRLIAKPQPGWRGFVECEVLEVVAEHKLAFSWIGNERTADRPMKVTFTLDDDGAGTRFTLDHEGFEGLGGWLLARLMMGPGWKKMMAKRLAAVLAE